jgi:hypothetical protein
MKQVVLLIYLVLTFRVFQFFPNLGGIHEFWFGVVLLAFVRAVYRKFVDRRDIGYSGLDLYLIAMMVAVPVWSAYAALAAYGQPIVLGLASQRSMLLLGGVVAFLHAVRRGWFSARLIERGFIVLAWSNLVLFQLMDLTLDPADLLDDQTGFVEVRGSAGMRFKFPGLFITIGLLYYSMKAMRRREPVYWLPVMVFYVFLLGDAGGRTLTMSLVVTLLFFAVRMGGLRRAARAIAVAGAVGALLLGTGWLVDRESTEARIDKFRDAFTIVLAGTEVDDASANVRLLQTLVALPYIEQNPVIGNGNISYRFSEDGFSSLLDAYFYPSDIGLVGVVYMYGFAGLLLFAFQYAFAVREGRRPAPPRNQALKDATNAFIFYTVVSSITNGFLAHKPEVVCTMIAVLWAANRAPAAANAKSAPVSVRLPRAV